MRPLQITVLISLLLALAAGFLSLNAAARAGRAEAALEETRLELTAALDQVRELLEQKAPAVAPPAERPRPLASPRGAREALAAAVPSAAPPAASPRPEESRPEILDRIEAIGFRVWEQRPVVRRRDVASMVMRALVAGLIRTVRPPPGGRRR